MKRLFSTATDKAKVVVFGGNGYVGSHVCRNALNLGYSVVSVNRSGVPHKLGANSNWVDQVQWVSGDLLQKGAWTEELKGAVGAVSCVGAFGSNEVANFTCDKSLLFAPLAYLQFMEKVNGDANIAAVSESLAAGDMI